MKKKASDLAGYLFLLFCIGFIFYEYGWYILFEYKYLISGCENNGEVINKIGSNFYEIEFTNCQGNLTSTTLESKVDYNVRDEILVRSSNLSDKIYFNKFQVVGFLIVNLLFLFCLIVVAVVLRNLYKLLKNKKTAPTSA